MDDDHQRRIATNESVFRRHNGTILSAVSEFARIDSSHGFMCECAISECEDMIDLTVEEYNQVRSDSSWFIVRPGHVIGGVEILASDRGHYWVVEKTGIAGEEARARAGL